MLLAQGANMSQLGRQWADEELTAFYQHFHNTTNQDWAKVCICVLGVAQCGLLTHTLTSRLPLSAPMLVPACLRHTH